MDADDGAEVYRNSRVGRMRFFVTATWFVAAGFLLAGIGFAVAQAAYDHAIFFIMAPIIAAAALGLEYYRTIYVTRIVARPEGLLVETEPRGGRVVRTLSWEVGFSNEIALTDRGSTTRHVWLRAPGLRPSLLVDTTIDPIHLGWMNTIRPPR
jgi:hypothetical protein